MPAMRALQLSYAGQISRAWPAPTSIIMLNLMAVTLRRGSAVRDAPASRTASGTSVFPRRSVGTMSLYSLRTL